MKSFTDFKKETASKLVSTIVPKSLRDELIAASGISDPRARLLAIRDVEERARGTYPRLFNAL